MENKIEKLYNDIEESIIKDPVNELQKGFNIALECVHSKLSHILGKSKTYTHAELMNEMEL